MSGNSEVTSTDATSSFLERWGLVLVSSTLVFLLAHAFVPIAEFVHRGDDAFYYFGVARNFPRYGFWTFDGVHPTNGVQPLWAILLTVLAYPLHWLRLPDLAMARVFVGLTATFHFLTGLLLYRLLSRTVSPGTGLAAAGGLLLPLGIVFSHVWGMENALYGTFLVGSVAYYHFHFLPRSDTRTAVVLGLLLGFTALSRLNSGSLVAFMGIAYLVSGPRSQLRQRVKAGLMVSLAVTAVVGPYVVWNLVTTGHVLPVSGDVKSVLTADWMAENGVEARASRDYLSAVYWRWRDPIEYYLTSRGLDGLWALGSRVVFKDSITTPLPLAATTRVLVGTLAGLLLLPLLFGDPKGWLAHLRERFRRLSRFWYVAAFAVFNAALSVLVYPTQVYAITRWWLAECEILVVVVVATLAVASVGYAAHRVLGAERASGIAVAAVALLVLYHGTETVRFYWDGERQTYDWNQSWNDHSYAAAMWMNENLPEDAVIGSWNAGVVGYFSERTLVNLDGLINNRDLLPYLRDGTMASYIRREGIEYLSDLQPMFDRVGIAKDLPLEPVYTSMTDWGEAYRIYRVLD